MSKANRKGTLEGLLRDLGSFGRFQVTMMQCVLIPKGLAGFSLVLPSFTAAPPDWWCLPVGANLSQSQRTNETFKVCSVNGSGCVREYGSNMVTSVSEVRLAHTRTRTHTHTHQRTYMNRNISFNDGLF